MLPLVALVLAAPLPFKAVAPGIEYAAVAWVEAPSTGDGVLHVVRIDPTKADLRVGLASQGDGKNRTAGDWADQLGFTAVINAGMYETDYRTNVGYLRAGTHKNQARWNKYQSVLAFGPGKGAMFDLDAGRGKDGLAAWPTVIQNLRLIKATGERSVWKEDSRPWSEAAVAADAQGRILFLFCRTPLTMKVFNEKLLALPLEITHAMHVEGGPPASFSLRTKGLKLDLAGTPESGLLTTENTRQWAVPNVLGVSPRP